MSTRRALIFSGICLLASSLAAADWEQWRGPLRNGWLPNSVPLRTSLPEEGLKPLWTSEVEISGGGNGGWSSPIVSNGKVFVFAHAHRASGVELPPPKYPKLTKEQEEKMAPSELEAYEEARSNESAERRSKQRIYQERLICMDLQTGAKIWEFERDSVFTRFPQSSSPVISDGKLFQLGADRKLYCLSTAKGELLWSTQLPVEMDENQIPASPAVADGTVLVAADQLFGVDASSGEVLWTGDEEQTDGRTASPSLWQHEDKVYAIAHVGRNDTVCFEPRTGKELWRVESYASRSTPVVQGDLLLTYGSSRKGGLRLFKMNADGAEQVWSYHRVTDPGSSPVIVGDCVYAQGETTIACLSLEEGKLHWKTELDLDRPRYTSLIAADNQVIYGFDGVLCFEASSEEFRPFFDARLNNEELLASADYYKEKLGLNELPIQEQDKIWNHEIARHGPLDCCSPAVADGKLILRLPKKIVCYDWKK